MLQSPLAWPANQPRTPTHRREGARFRVDVDKALDDLYDELERLGATNVLVTSNAALTMRGFFHRGKPEPADRGVAVHFDRKGRPLVIACDKWFSVVDNIRAIGLTVAAIRALERYGTTDAVDAALSGFAALPIGDGWWSMLGTEPTADEVAIERAYRERAKVLHPDAGGSAEAFRALTEARDEALAARRMA